MPKPWYSIKAAADANSVDEVSILEPIDTWYGVDAKSFLTEFRALKGKKVKLSINSPGGSVVEALAIFNGMRATGKEIEVHVLGLAASAASYIAMAGDKIVMPRNTLMFLHNPISGAYGNAEDLREVADTLDKIGAMLTGTYMRRFTGTEDELKALLADEALLTADECLKYGLCDEVVAEITAQARFDVEGLPERVQALFRPAPAVPTPPAPSAAAPVAMADIERIAAEVGVTEYAAALALDDTLTTLDAVQARARDVAEIHALCRVVGATASAAGFVQARKAIADVRAELAAARAAADESTNTSTARPSASQQPAQPAVLNPLALWGQIEAMRQK